MTRTAFIRNVLRLVVGIGGGRADAFPKYRRGAENTIAIVADVPVEVLKTRRKVPSGLPAFYLPLGEGHTLETLVADAGDEVCRVARSQMGAASSRDGMGQQRRFGHAAALQLVKTKTFETLGEQLRDAAYLMTNGQPLQVQIRVIGSLSGGVCSGAAEVLGEAIAQELKKLAISIDLTYDLLDPTPFAGYGPRVLKNAAAGISEFASYVSERGYRSGELIVRTLHVSAQAPCLHDLALRAKFVAADEQAMVATETQQLLREVESNEALTSVFGNITYRSTSFANILDSRDVLAPAIAREYLDLVAVVIRSAVPIRGLVSEITFRVTASPLPQDTIDDIAEQVSALSEEDVLSLVEQPSQSMRHDAIARSKGPRCDYDLETLQHEFLSECPTLSASQERIATLGSIVQAVFAELEATREDCENLAVEQARRRKTVAKTTAKLQGGGLWGEAKRLEAFIDAASELRACCEQLQEQLSQKRGLERAFDKALAEEAREVKKLTDLEAALAEFALRAKSDEQLVVTRHVDEAFPELREIPASTAETRVELLCAQVKEATLLGLQRITDAPEPSVSAILRALKSGLKHHGPFVGGTVRDHGKTLNVFPPVAKAVEAEIREASRQLDEHQLVAFADHAAAAVTIVSYLFARPNSVDELFPGVLAHEALALKNDPRAPMYHTHPESKRILPTSNGRNV